MSSEIRKEKLTNLIEEYNRFKKTGKLDLTSEETIRTWLNQLLEIFGWDVRDTSQILQEKVLSKSEKERVKDIGSQNTRPDYTFKIAKQKLSFLDAKDITVKLLNDSDAAFQIKSYGWSILAPCAFISNFEEFAIYDCTYEPEKGQDPNLGRLYFTIDTLLDNYQILEDHLLKDNIYSGKLNELYSATLIGNKHVQRITPDIKFASQLSEFRLALATDILYNNKAYIGSNSTNLSYITQIIINRVLFIRVCEARSMEEDGLLLSFQKQGFWESFKKSSYFDFYEHYDGPLFERINSIHDLNISNKVFDTLIQNLYYPSPYKFEVIPTKLLSDIYELFLSKKLVIEEDKVKDEIKDEYLKTNGAVTTPQYIVEEIIRRTINRNALIESGIENLLSVKVLDIACGSGVFATILYDYLEDVFLELYATTAHPDFSKYFHTTERGEVIANVLAKKAIIDNCIFGVDIDPEAVEVAKMSLSLKIIDTSDYRESYGEIGVFGTKILNGVGNNIKCGNSLVESDILELHPELSENIEELIKTNIFDWNNENGFKEIFDKKSGFDFIVGNPPYVEVKNYNVDLPFMHKYIKEKFPSAKNGKVDLAIPFIEKSINLLNEEGRLGFIIQKRFFKTTYGKKIREIITNENYLSSIIDFDQTNIFRDRMTYVALLILDKDSPENFSYKCFTGNVELLGSDLRETQLPEISPVDYLILPSSSIGANPWSFDDAKLIAIKSRLSKFGNLGDFASVRVGIQALKNEAYHIRPISIKDGILTGKTHLEDSFEIELDACCHLLPNENFYPYRSDLAESYCIFPYKVENGNSSEILFTEFCLLYPLAGKYLSRHKPTIQKLVETFPGERWHLYTRANNIGRNFPKVYIPMTSLDTFAAITFSEKHYCDNANVNFIELPEINELNLYAMSAVINSIVFSVLARSIANPQSKGYFKFNKQFLEPVPFPKDAFTNNIEIKEQLRDVAKKIESLQNRFIIASPHEKRALNSLLSAQWINLDKLCYQLYGLTNEEEDFFNERGRNINRIEILK